MYSNNVIKIKTAAKCLGVGEQTVRIGLQRGLLDFGYAVKDDGENHRWRYVIPRGRFINKTGISAEAVDKVEAEA